MLLSRSGISPRDGIKFRTDLTILRPKKLKTRKSFLYTAPRFLRGSYKNRLRQRFLGNLRFHGYI